MADKKVLTSDFTTLREKVKSEMAKRRFVGQAAGSVSVEQYSTGSWDYSTTPTDGGPIRDEYAKKIIVPIRAVNPNGTSSHPNMGNYPGTITEQQMEDMNLALDAWDRRNVADQSGSDCQTGCTGACYGSCAGTCLENCDTGCKGDCYTACARNCAEACTGECTTGCKTGCKTDLCKNNCGSECSSWGCYRQCANDCENYCLNTCGGGCTSLCGSNGCTAICGGDGGTQQVLLTLDE